MVKLLSALAVASFRHPRLTLGLSALVTVLSWWGASRLSISADLTELLPRSFESVRAVEALRERYGGIGYVAVVLEGTEPGELEQLAHELAPKLERLESVRWVEYRRPEYLLRDKALYLMERHDLQSLHARLKARSEWETAHANPFYIDLEDSKPPELDFSDLRAKYGAANAEEQGAFYSDRDGRRLVLLVKPTRLASDLDFVKRVTADVRAEVRQATPQAMGIEVAYTGRYVKKVELQRTVQRDLAWSGIAALLLIAGYLLVHFRSARALPLMLVPLVAGLSWTYGFAGVALGNLNVLTAFVGAVLLGIGVDNGVHLLGRYLQERDHDPKKETAVARAWGRTGRPAVVAVLTTMAGIGSLISSEFRAFREFGLLGATGLVLVLLAYLVVLPALLGLFGHRANAARPPTSRYAIAGTTLRHAPWVAWVVLLIALPAVVAARHVRFDYDFASLDATDLPSYVLDRDVNRILGRSQTPLVVMTDTADEAAEVAEAIVDRAGAKGADPLIQGVVTERDLVPTDQAERQPVLQSISAMLRKLDPASLSDAQRKGYRWLEDATQTLPFSARDLPASLTRGFRGVDQKGSFALVLPAISLSDGQKVRQLAEKLRALPLANGETMDAAGEAMVLADVLGTVFRETPRSVATALAVIALLVLVMTRSFRTASMALIPAALSLAATFGVLAWLDIPLNYLNLVVLPVLLGMGVDSGVHFATHLQESRTVEKSLQHVGPSIAGALCTTGAGFAALLLAHQPGLRSVAHVALVGLGASLVMGLLWLPAWTQMWRRGIKHRHPSALVSTVGLGGLAPIGPGTLGALLSVPAAWALREVVTGWRVSVLVAATVAGTWTVARYMRNRDEPDPQEIVFDEWIGCLIAVVLVPWSALWVIAAFVLFRLFDILKPWPITWLHHRVPGALGVVGDDVVAGMMAGGSLWLVANWV